MDKAYVGSRYHESLGEKEGRKWRKQSSSDRGLDQRQFRSSTASSTQVATEISVGTVKWDMLRRLQDEKALLYSLQDRELAKIQAALRNNSKTTASTAQTNAGAHRSPKLPWFAIDSRGVLKQRWDMFLAIVIVYSVFMLPLRLGFDFEATGAFFYLVYCTQTHAVVMAPCR
jgi:hypothetical protein